MEQKSSSKDLLKETLKDVTKDSARNMGFKNREERLRRLREKQKAKGLSTNGSQSFQSTNSQVGSSQAKSGADLKPDLKSELKSDQKMRRFPRQVSNRPSIANHTIQNNPQNLAVSKSHPTAPRINSTPKPTPKSTRSIVKSSSLQVLRTVVAGIGLSVIAGTLIAFWQSYAANGNLSGSIVASSTNSKKTSDAANAEPIGVQLKTELAPLTAKIKELAAAEPDLGLQVLAIDLDTSSYVNIGANQPIASASLIKMPVLIAFLEDVGNDKVRFDESIELKTEDIVGESGDLQYRPLGTRLSYLEVLTKMITISDNTATNIIIKRLGGKDLLNQRFKAWGLTSTVIRNLLPDITGTNTTSPQDLVNLLAMVDRGKLLTLRNHDRFMDIMQRTETDTLLPKGLSPEARIAHKTGDIRSSVGDAGIVDMPNGKRYIVAAIVKRPDNDQRANQLIRDVSRAIYENLSTANRPPLTPLQLQNPAQNPAQNVDPNLKPTPNTDQIPVPNPDSSPNPTPSEPPQP